MTIPFLDLLKKLTGRFGGGASVAESPTSTVTRVVRPKKPESERLSKTVMPNATRSFSAPDPFRSAAATVTTPRSNMPLELGAQRITASQTRPRAAQLPPALARALEPKVERTISLRVADLVDAVPAGFIKPIEILDTNAVVSLKASEIEKGMPDKHPMISLPSLYQQVPEIFLRSVSQEDETRVELPYQKVLEQFQNAHVRSDQLRDPTIPHVDTPILAATIQDSKRFGTKIEPIETTPLPPVPVKPATAESIADAEPDATPAQPQVPTKKTPSDHRVVSLHSPELKPKSASSEASATESEISFELSPNGTGASASERVPASSGPPVPTPLPFTPDLAKIAFGLPPEKPVTNEPKETSETPIASAKAPVEKPAIPAPKRAIEKPKPLRVSECAEEAAPVMAPTKTIPAPALPVPPIISAPTEIVPSISFSLKAVLQDVPAFQFNGDMTAVSDEARITLPLTLIESQLAGGRVSIAPDVFQAALPEEYRSLFQVDVAKTPVALPLEEVLKNLPVTVLKLREDQEAISLDKDFETPFLVKAQEDARRFAPKTESAETISKERAKEPVTESKTDTVTQTEPVIAKPTREKIDPKEIVMEANALSGVKACAITFSDGLSLAGELPEQLEADGLAAMAPTMLERIAQHVRETKLGRLVTMTLYASDSAVSFFARGNICLTALHDRSLAPETRTQLAELAEKLSRTYTQPEQPNVDH
jgi:predicted regulator of Ras-like GTPase activity (Roadblock/LC7/MglB family)